VVSPSGPLVAFNDPAGLLGRTATHQGNESEQENENRLLVAVLRGLVSALS